MVKVPGIPLQALPAAEGVTVMVAVTALLPLFTATNDGMSPVPLAARPIDGVSFVQVKVVPVPVKFTAFVAFPPFRAWGGTVFTIGAAFTMPVTGIKIVVAPTDDTATLPERLGLAGAEAAERTYIGTLSSTPPLGVSVIVLPKPPPGVRDISKLLGAFKTTSLVKLIPDWANCRIFGLADADPAQAEMVPVTAVAVRLGAAAGSGFTVMVNLMGTPVQPEPGEIKFPSEPGPAPTLTGCETAFVLLSITNMLFEFSLLI